MKFRIPKMLTVLGAMGLLAAVAGSAGADVNSAPWIFSGATANHSHNGLSVNYRCDTFGIAERTRASNNNLRVGHSFRAVVQCWNGYIANSNIVSGGSYSSATTSACTTAQGGAAAGRVDIFH